MRVLILAGGKGTRLWPVSRKNKPKQLQAIFSTRSLLQETAERATLFARSEDIYIVVSNDFQLAEVQAQLPNLPADHIMKEPDGRSTAAAIAFATATMCLRGVLDNECIAVLSADHRIGNPDLLAEKLRTAEEHLQTHPTNLVTIGVTPTYPETGYGYISLGTPIAPGIFTVREFHEKPNQVTAIQYVTAGDVLWNSGIFMWQAKTILERLRSAHTAYASIIDGVLAEKNLAEIYSTAPTESIDRAVLEHDQHTVVLPAALTWTDIGHWQAVRDWQMNGSTKMNAVTGRHVGIDTTGCLVVNHTGRMIATVGIDNLIIIDTPDALLICHSDRAQDVRKLVEEIETQGNEPELT